MSKRYILTALPVEHINGKMSRTSQIVKNSETSEPSSNAFYYGYRRNHSRVSRFGLRELPRNLIINPYTTRENDNRRMFRISAQIASVNLKDAGMRAKVQADFTSQKKYKVVYNYAVAMTRANAGEWPAKWQ